ncbi:family S53 protease [Roridomyces roridus]|uniref:tripeptidyl-peptidase II n=1 Tax=Roridomyces roridus TaxID=1738132 RepID=A0AAD7BBG3_9AGAR|nr:family S53 protease [Roridomyces roridus]KAJ7644991.1 family S53 protease [Roridomyces roridus]
MVFATAVFASLLLIASAKPLERRMVMHETRAAAPQGFVHTSAAPAAKELTLRIAMPPTDIAGLESALMTVSDPASDLYGQHLTLDEVNEFVKPTAETLQTVSAWLSENNITPKTITPAGDQLSITIPVSQANELFSAEFSVFTHVESGAESIRTLAYHLPAELIGHVDFIHPTVSFTPPISGQPLFSAIEKTPVAEVAPVSDAVPTSCNTVITPACLQAMYGIPATATKNKNNILAVSGFIDEWANQADLKQFLTAFRTDMNSSTTFTLQTLDGGVNTQTRSSAGVEANLDIQYTIGVATGAPITFISVGDSNSDGISGFLDIITTISKEATGTRPNVLTTSYGFNEPDLSRAVATTLCNSYMALGAMGTSLLFSSGDGGVSGSQSQSCTTFIPTIPSNCPWVTSVGATQNIAETAASFSSGGFGNYFPIPSYQATDVAGYISAIGTTNSGKYNASGRGFPDISFQGVNFEIAWDAQTGTVSGTSCSSPAFASVIALLNDELITAGKSPLGFLNPFLYSTTGRAAFTDITTGTNPGCSTNGFSARAGWDPVTGLGTPNYAKLRTAVGLS